MDVSSIVATISVIGAVLAGAFTFLNRERYKEVIFTLQTGSDEVRKQNAELKEEKTELEKQFGEQRVKCEQQDIRIKELKELNSKQPDFASLTGLISTNHKESMEKLTELAKTIVEHK